MAKMSEIKIETNLFDVCEEFYDCTVKILLSSETNDLVLLWFDNNKKPLLSKKKTYKGYDVIESHDDCTVQVLKNSITGEESTGWWRNEKPPKHIGDRSE